MGSRATSYIVGWSCAPETILEAPSDVEVQGSFKLVRPSHNGLIPGVYRSNDDDEGIPSWDWFCSYLEVLADTRDADNQSWGRLLRLVDRDGVTHEWAMPMALLAGDGADYRRELLSLGLELGPGRADREALQRYIALWRPDSRVRCVSRTGWAGQAFILPDATIGNTAGERVLLQTNQTTSRYAVAGSLENWKRDVARLAIGNSRLAFGIAASFAGPLLHFLGEESGGYHFMGGSSIGKTTILRAGVSVWGCSLDGWRTTDNGAERLAESAADALLCLDEIGQAESRAVEALAYMLGNERGKVRMKRDGTNRPPITWRVLFLSTGEIGLADKLGEYGKRARAGQTVRVVEIVADTGRGFGVFDCLHKFTDGDQLARHLKQAAERNKGHAARLFLKRLTQDLDQAVQAVVQRRKRWLASYLPADADGQVCRVAGRFALVAAAGELAAAMDVLPWEPGEADQAAARCFADWLAGRGGHGPAELREGLRQVKLFLEQYGSSRFDEIEPAGGGERPSFNRAGFRRKHGANWEYLVLPQAWRAEVCQGLDHAAIARAMIERNWMASGDGKNLAKKLRIPGIGQPRAYVIKANFLAADIGP